MTEWFVVKVDIHPTSDRIGDYESWRGQVVGAHQRVNAGFEVPIPAQHGGHNETIGFDGFVDLLRKRAAVSDARHAAVADDVEAELLEVGQQSCLSQVVGHNATTRRQSGLDPRLHVQALLHRPLGKDAGPDHDGRVRRVGAARNRCDDDGAVPDLVALTVGFYGARASWCRLSDCDRPLGFTLTVPALTGTLATLCANHGRVRQFESGRHERRQVLLEL